MPEVPLAKAIAALRAELQDAIDEGADKKLKFSLETVELELTAAITVRGEASASAGLWKVLSLGTKVDGSRDSTHRLLLRLSPKVDGARETLIGDDTGGRPE